MTNRHCTKFVVVKVLGSGGFRKFYKIQKKSIWNTMCWRLSWYLTSQNWGTRQFFPVQLQIEARIICVSWAVCFGKLKYYWSFPATTMWCNTILRLSRIFVMRMIYLSCHNVTTYNFSSKYNNKTSASYSSYNRLEQQNNNVGIASCCGPMWNLC